MLPIILLAVALVYAQYYYKSTYKNELSSIRTFILACLRALVYVGILFILLNPRVKFSSERIEKPLLIWAQDNSQSLQLNQDSSYYKNKYAQDIDAVLGKLEDKYQIQRLSFGQEVKHVKTFSFSDQFSDYASLFSYIKENITVGDGTQLILAGDGLYNKGNDPRFLVQEIKCPVHTIALGDEADKKDVSVVNLRSNKLAFLKSNMPVRFALKADFCKGEKIEFYIQSGSEVLHRDTLKVTTDDFFIEKDFFIAPSRVGLQKYILKVKPIEGETNLKNNVGELIVDVLDSKRKVAICYDSYHPDIAALQSALQEKSNFSVSLIDISKKQVRFSDFNLLILHQLPSFNTNTGDFFSQLKSSRLPFMLILGGGTELTELNRLNLGLSFAEGNKRYQNARLKLDVDFSLFEINQENRNTIESFPPLLSPRAKCYFNQENMIMGMQIVKGVETDLPLIVFSQVDEQKQCYILGEGIWRWKLHDYKENDSHENFNTLIGKMVQYLALKVKKDQLNIQYDNVYVETDLIHIEAQLYNKSYQPTNKADIEFLLTSESGKVYDYQFEKRADVYHLDLKGLSAGNYTFKASAKASDQEFVGRGAFVIVSENLEAKHLKANSALLKDLSELSKGLHVNLDQIDQLTESLLNNSIKPRLSITNNFSLILNFIWILYFILILLVMEWFLRKYWLGI